jgi:hypothetical protein
MPESAQSSEPTTSASERTASTQRDCRETPAIAPTSIASDLVDIVGGAILGLVLGAILIA